LPTLLLGDHVIKKGFHIAMHIRDVHSRALLDVFRRVFGVSPNVLVEAPDFEPQPASESVEKGHG
jgi:hypothetical protein